MTAFNCLVGCKKRDVSKTCNGGPVKRNASFGQPFLQTPAGSMIATGRLLKSIP
jgi:hypothetical protein